ncbi:MAG: hypothetical protein QF712_02580 [Candidatus Marinimicrobia bacterium]|nr:hypothetical protein [Candidatus Neomarinimicrobiota bacterium]MDP6568813.1 hypothetical protein [Candidatus Neomarinimicrobiota bacterium]
MKFFVPKIIIEWRSIFREGGVKLLIRRKGWSIVFLFLIFYLIRDSFLYILIPYLAVNGIITCSNF